MLLVTGCAGTGGEDETAGWSVEKLYAEAKDAMDSKNWPAAIKYFEKLEARYPYGRYAQEAQLDIAYAHWKAEEPAAAIAAVDRFMKQYPNHPNVDYAYYLKGLINFNANQGLFAALAGSDMSDRDPKAALDAFFTFKELVTRFPDSRYAPDARARMRYLVNSLAGYEVHAARYYMDRGAYIAAAARAQYAVRHYPTSPVAEQALAIMVKAYGALGLPELQRDARRVLLANFPKTKYLSAHPYRHDVPWWRLWDPDW